MSKIKGLRINESTIILEDGRPGKLAVLLYHGASDPSTVLDHAVS